MRVNTLSLQQFRNYPAQDFSFDGRCNVIYGENAQGKDQSAGGDRLSLHRPLARARSDREMIRFEADSALLRLRFLPGNGTLCWKPGCSGGGRKK